MRHVVTSCCVAVTISVIVGGAAPAQQPAAQRPLREPDVIYLPTPPAVVAAMLKVANVGPGDVVYDLGSGDGRIPISHPICEWCTLERNEAGTRGANHNAE